MARKKDERLVKQAYKEERKAKAAQKKNDGGASEPYLQPNDDHFVSFKNQLATMGLMLRDIPGDGNCLFRALNDQVEGHSRNHLRLRHDTVRFMMEHRADFEPFVEDDVPFQTHVRQLSQPGTYGGHDALVAFARMLKVNIVIHQLNSPLWQIEGGPNGCSQLHLSYHNGEHYSSVRRAGDTSESAANVRINVTAGVPETSSSTSKKKNLERQFPSCHNDAVGGCVYNDDENTVQKIANRTGCKDLSLIHEALADYCGDEVGATDYIMSCMLATDPDANTDLAIISGDEIDESASACAAGAATRKTDNRCNKPKEPPPKKLTNKQRKENNRREKATRGRAVDQAPSAENGPGQADDAAMVVEAAFGCLRI